MFESIKHWFESAEAQTHLFEHRDQETIHLALASVLHHIINQDHHESRKELLEFRNILRSEFNLNDSQIEYLHQTVEHANGHFQDDLETISHYLKDSPQIKRLFLEKLIHLISIDGVMEDELTDFYRAVHLLFPEVKTD